MSGLDPEVQRFLSRELSAPDAARVLHPDRTVHQRHQWDGATFGASGCWITWKPTGIEWVWTPDELGSGWNCGAHPAWYRHRASWRQIAAHTAAQPERTVRRLVDTWAAFQAIPPWKRTKAGHAVLQLAVDAMLPAGRPGQEDLIEWAEATA